jgi:hypothetical protein
VTGRQTRAKNLALAGALAAVAALFFAITIVHWHS